MMSVHLFHLSGLLTAVFVAFAFLISVSLFLHLDHLPDNLLGMHLHLFGHFEDCRIEVLDVYVFKVDLFIIVLAYRFFRMFLHHLRKLLLLLLVVGQKLLVHLGVLVVLIGSFLIVVNDVLAGRPLLLLVDLLLEHHLLLHTLTIIVVVDFKLVRDVDVIQLELRLCATSVVRMAPSALRLLA